MGCKTFDAGEALTSHRHEYIDQSSFVCQKSGKCFKRKHNPLSPLTKERKNTELYKIADLKKSENLI